MAIAYWGRKSKEYMCQLINLYPLEEIDTVVDACMGSGSFSANIACQMVGVKQIGIELDRGVYTLHKVIKEQYEELIDMILQYHYSEESYSACRKMIRQYNQRHENYGEVEIAFAELVILFYSYNGMRGNKPRRFDSYERYEGEERKRMEDKLKCIYNRFFLKAPGDIVSLHFKWQQLQIENGDFMDYDDLWKNSKVWIYIDPPYELSKRGIDEQKTKGKSQLGYDFDMDSKKHDIFISRLEQFYENNELNAKFVICTNYELDELGKIVIPADDRYSKLLEIGFKRVVIEKKACSNMYYSTNENNKGACKRRHRKAEVVYINYCIDD